MRIAEVENNALIWVSISSAGALDMTHCDFSVRSARDEMRQIIESSEPDVIVGSDRDQNRGCTKKEKDHMEFLCELYEAKVARGRYFVHGADVRSELENEVRGEGHGHVGNKNGSGRSVHVRVGRVRRGRTRVCQRKCADDDQCETSWCAVAQQMRKHASTRSGQRGQHNRDEGTDRIVGSPSLKQWRSS